MDLAPGAEADPIAQQLAQRIRAGLAQGAKPAFDALAGTIALVLEDADVALTLRFDFGRVTIHEGLVGAPDVTIRCRLSGFEALLGAGPSGGSLVEKGSLLVRRWRKISRERRANNFRIYGLVTHPALIARLLRVLGGPTPLSLRFDPVGKEH